MTKTAFVDLDDTLIFCSRYYVEARDRGAALIEEVTGMDKNAAAKLIASIDLDAARAATKFDKERYPNSFKTALVAACVEKGVEPTDEAMDKIYEIGYSVFDAEYALRPNARMLLDFLDMCQYQVVIVTKGDVEVQARKIELHNLQHHVDAVQVVEEKTPEVWEAVCEVYGVDVASSFVIGDSLKDDIVPCQKLGLKTVHMKNEDAWVYNNSGDVTPNAVVTDLHEVLPWLQAQYATSA